SPPVKKSVPCVPSCSILFHSVPSPGGSRRGSSAEEVPRSPSPGDRRTGRVAHALYLLCVARGKTEHPVRRKRKGHRRKKHSSRGSGRLIDGGVIRAECPKTGLLRALLDAVTSISPPPRLSPSCAALRGGRSRPRPRPRA